jgi:hypothetical protein
MPAPDISLAHTVSHICPSIGSRREDHQRKQPRRGKAERMAFDKPNLNQIAGLNKFVALLCGYNPGDLHCPPSQAIVILIVWHIL